MFGGRVAFFIEPRFTIVITTNDRAPHCWPTIDEALARAPATSGVVAAAAARPQLLLLPLAGAGRPW